MHTVIKVRMAVPSDCSVVVFSSSIWRVLRSKIELLRSNIEPDHCRSCSHRKRAPRSRGTCERIDLWSSESSRLFANYSLLLKLSFISEVLHLSSLLKITSWSLIFILRSLTYLLVMFLHWSSKLVRTSQFLILKAVVKKNFFTYLPCLMVIFNLWTLILDLILLH